MKKNLITGSSIKVFLIFLFYFYAIFLHNLLAIALGNGSYKHSNEIGLRISTFDIDATPEIGSYLSYQRMVNTWDMSLRARGVVLLGAGKPIVLCAVDWIDISGGSQDEFKRVLANAAGTIPERVAVHTVHQHDAPRSNFSVEQFLKDAGLDPLQYEGTFAREALSSLETAVQNSLNFSEPFTHIGHGAAQVFKVASNRRILGYDGRIRAGRMSSSRDSALRAEPEGLIDPMISVISFWNDDKPLAVLSYYATHPMSYYLTGIPNPDFPGIARFMRQLAVPDALHVYFTGAGGNIAAGKYNDGSLENRLILAERLADGMKRAWESTLREPVTSGDIFWRVEQVALPLAEYIESIPMENIGMDSALMDGQARIPREQVWLQRYRAGKKIDIGCLIINNIRILHMPGELCVEYQLAAKAYRPDLFVAMAAYGDNGSGYICTAEAYEQGGYEAGRVSQVSPEVEEVLMRAIRKLLID